MSVERAERLYRGGLDALADLPEARELAGRRVCVVGCTGLVGGNLTSALLRCRPAVVYGVARRPPPSPPHDVAPFVFLRGSAADAALLERVPYCDYVVYVAGTASDYRRRVRETLHTQVVGLEAFLTRSAGCRGFVYVSSTRVYGRATGDTPVDEEFAATVPPMHTDNLYDSAKRLGESLCLHHAEEYDLPAVVVRPTNLYGLTDSPRATTVIADFVTQARERGRVEPRGHPDSVRNYCCALDVAQGILRALARGRAGRAYNLGSDEHLSGREWAETVAAALPSRPQVVWPEAPPAPSVQRVSVARARAELGYEPRHRFRDLAPLTVARVAAQGDRS